ncbi:hypothetical protein QTP70_033640 [Hemibagrus guttatus]|uniref:Uncharacterized protein n=1 Tax=Hemibagrus guttatus TaxID=175788 RepID=A0AAE0RLQ2_9TELE|nr:hypothetical protein QTP70_033640 [Hemibagrus guttatus]
MEYILLQRNLGLLLRDSGYLQISSYMDSLTDGLLIGQICKPIRSVYLCICVLDLINNTYTVLHPAYGSGHILQWRRAATEYFAYYGPSGATSHHYPSRSAHPLLPGSGRGATKPATGS